MTEFEWDPTEKKNVRRRIVQTPSFSLPPTSPVNISPTEENTEMVEKSVDAQSQPLMSVRSMSIAGGSRSLRNRLFKIRHGNMGHSSHSDHDFDDEPNIDSLNYLEDESEIWRSHKVTEHHLHRGRFWNTGRHHTTVRYVMIALIGIVQGMVAYFTNIFSSYFIQKKFETVNDILNEGQISGEGNMTKAFFYFFLCQTTFAALASAFVTLEPVSAGSGIPEIKCFLNGIDLPNVTSLKVGFCKVFGVICSVSAGLPVGKEGPMVHSGAVVAMAVTSSSGTRDDKAKRDFVACGASAGVCTAFSAPIGGILFTLEEGASYWFPSLTWRTFFCSMIALATLYTLNTIGIQFGKVGFDKLFSFGNFVYEGDHSSFAVYELLLFALVGVLGGMIGACFNAANEYITHWRIIYINHSKLRRFLEVLVVSSLVTIVTFVLPLLWGKCTPLPKSEDLFNLQEKALVQELVPFGCKKGEEYNEVASLIFTESSVAIRLLFHMQIHTFTPKALLCFFIPYISLAAIVYGIAVPSGLFVPSLLSGAAFGRLFGNLMYKLHPTNNFAFSNIYSLIGAASVLGGMARMTISLTVILLECTGNEQFVLPLMISLMTARIIGGLFNEDLYHIHIHLKRGVHFLENELRSITRHHSLVAGQIMGRDVVFVRPVEKVGIVYDILKSCTHSNFPVVDTDDNNILFGTIGRHKLCTILQNRAYGNRIEGKFFIRNEDYAKEFIEIEPDKQKFFPLVQWNVLGKIHYPSIEDIEIDEDDFDCLIDLRPYVNTSPYSVQETCSIGRTYNLFRSLGLRLLVVVNKYNQCVGTITRDDLTADSLAQHMLTKGKQA